ncbi:MAG: hypothetical protein OXM58_07045 [Rhodospirillaceae bacterium]|nr:hypothetical protein [Rhodospirillaceae bacterium]MDE0619892.1 hypothetical protein [Rhodospirillaceae bacterium]
MGERDGTVFEQAHRRRRPEQAADMREGGDADAAALPARADAAVPALFGPAGGVARFGQARSQAAGRDRLAADPAPSGLDGIFQPQLDRIEAQPVGQLVDLRFGGEGHLRVAVAAEAGGAQPVGVDGASPQPAVWDFVGAARHQQAEAEHGRAVLRIGAAVVDDVEIAGDQGAAGLRAGPDADDGRMTPAHRHEVFLPGQRQLDRPAGRPGEMGDQRLDRDAGLAAERAADRRRDDADLRHRQVEGPRQGRLHLVDRLVGGPDGQLAGAVELGNRGDRFQIDVRLGRHLVDALDDDIAIGPGRLDVAFAELLARDLVDALEAEVRAFLVALEFPMDRDRAVFQRRRDAQHRRQLFVVHLDQRRRRAGRGEVGSGDRGDRLADIAHHAGGERGLVVDEQAPAARRQVGPGQHRLDAGQRPGGGRIDAEDPRARPGAAEDRGVQHARPRKIVCIARRTGQLVGGVAARQPRADRFGKSVHRPAIPGSLPTARRPAFTAASTMLT